MKYVPAFTCFFSGKCRYTINFSHTCMLYDVLYHLVCLTNISWTTPLHGGPCASQTQESQQFYRPTREPSFLKWSNFGVKYIPKKIANPETQNDGPWKSLETVNFFKNMVIFGIYVRFLEWKICFQSCTTLSFQKLCHQQKQAAKSNDQKRLQPSALNLK